MPGRHYARQSQLGFYMNKWLLYQLYKWYGLAIILTYLEGRDAHSTDSRYIISLVERPLSVYVSLWVVLVPEDERQKSGWRRGSDHRDAICVSHRQTVVGGPPPAPAPPAAS